MSVLGFKKERIPQYDLMRAAAMFLVVYVHSSFMFNFTPEPDSKQAGLYWFTSVLALVCNSLFFMVSGKFNLAQAVKLKFDGYRTFYTKKVIDLLIPVVLYAVTFWILRFIGIEYFGAWDGGIGFWDIGAFFNTFHELLVSSWWFVSMIFSLMIFTPFIGRMLGNLKNKEVYVLLAVLFGCYAIIALEELFGHTTFLSKFLAPIFGIWLGVYMMGYVIDGIKFTPGMMRRWYIASGVMLAVFGAIFVFAPQISLSQEGGPLASWNMLLSAVFYPVVSGALYLFFKNINIVGDRTKKIIEFVGNRAYGIYLIHFCFYFSFLQLLPDWLREADNAVGGIVKRLIIAAIVFLASLVIATLVDLFVVNPVQKRLKSRLIKK